MNYFMIKKILILFCFFFLADCTTPTSALLGPIFTGAKTGSIYQASLSYGTGKVMNKLNPYDFVFKDENQRNSTLNISNSQNYNDLPELLASYRVDKIEFSEPIEPEPLP